MRRLPKRKGISLGTVTMLALTAIVIVGCGWLFPKLVGKVDFQLDPHIIAVSIDETLSGFTSASGRHTASPTAPPMAAPLQSLATAQPAVATKPPKLSFSLTAAGSIQITSVVQKALTDDSGYRFPILFEALKGEVSGDLSIAALENTVILTDKLTDNNVPVDVLTAINGGGFNALYLGYSNILNSGIKGLSATMEAIRAAGMVPYGVYATQEERGRLILTDINGVSIGLLGYQSDISSNGKKKLSKNELTFAIAPPTLPTIAEDIAAARKAGAQVIIVSLCWGKEGSTTPSQTQRELAQGIANAGADIILGTHSGTLQPVEVLTATRSDGSRSKTLCAYSLGNLFTQDRDKRVSIASILLHSQVEYDVSTGEVDFPSLTYTPTYIWRGKENNKTLYRVLVSDQPAPSFMQEDQEAIMKRCLELVTEVMKDSPVKIRK